MIELPMTRDYKEKGIDVVESRIQRNSIAYTEIQRNKEKTTRSTSGFYRSSSREWYIHIQKHN